MRNLCITFISILLSFPAVVNAQFVHFQMNVEPELSTDVVQDIDFGTFITNSGTQRIQKGSASMGIFEIRGLRNQRIAVTLNTPENLVHSNPDISQTIPVSLDASFTNNSVRDIGAAQPFSENEAWFAIGTGGAGNQQTWQSAFVYIYGSVTIGEVPDGAYEGTLVLTVEYQ